MKSETNVATDMTAGSGSVDCLVRIVLYSQSDRWKILAAVWLFTACAAAMAISRAFDGDWLCGVWCINATIYCWMWFKGLIFYPNAKVRDESHE